jgi:hypothetical protein
MASDACKTRVRAGEHDVRAAACQQPGTTFTPAGICRQERILQPLSDGFEHRLAIAVVPAGDAAPVPGADAVPRQGDCLRAADVDPAGQGRRKASSGPGPPLRLSASPDRGSCHERTAQKSRSSSAPGRPSCSVIHQ